MKSIWIGEQTTNRVDDIGKLARGLKIKPATLLREVPKDKGDK